MGESKDMKSGPFHAPHIRDDETVERLGPFYFIQKKNGHRLTSDSVLLSDFITGITGHSRVIDIGAGTGAIPLLIAGRSQAAITAVEIEPGACETAGRNFESNNLAGRCKSINSDYRDLPDIYPAGSFDIIVSNPPYTRKGAGRPSPNKERQMARSEVMGGLSDLIAVSRHLAGDHGRIFYVFPVARLFEMLREVKKARLSVVRLRFVHFDRKQAARLFLIELGYKGTLRIEEPLFV